MSDFGSLAAAAWSSRDVCYYPDSVAKVAAAPRDEQKRAIIESKQPGS